MNQIYNLMRKQFFNHELEIKLNMYLFKIVKDYNEIEQMKTS